MAKNAIAAVIVLLVANSCVVFSFFLSEWITTDIGGTVEIGIWETCIANGHQYIQRCSQTDPPFSWRVAIACMATGVMFSSFAIVAYICSLVSSPLIYFGKWFNMASLASMSMASILIPLGFKMEPINGEPFQLPSSYNVMYQLDRHPLNLISFSL